MRYRTIERCRDAFLVCMICRCLRVSPSGYYGWRERPASLRKQANERLLVCIRSLDAESDGVFSSPRMRDALRYSGRRVAAMVWSDGLIYEVRRARRHAHQDNVSGPRTSIIERRVANGRRGNRQDLSRTLQHLLERSHRMNLSETKNTDLLPTPGAPQVQIPIYPC